MHAIASLWWLWLLCVTLSVLGCRVVDDETSRLLNDLGWYLPNSYPLGQRILNISAALIAMLLVVGLVSFVLLGYSVVIIATSALPS